MRYCLQRHDGTDCSATMVPITVLRMVPIQRYRHFIKRYKMSWHYKTISIFVRFFLEVDYFKPVNNSFRKKEANDEICIDT